MTMKKPRVLAGFILATFAALTIAVWAQSIPGVTVFDTIVPSSTNDTYPTHKAIYGMGGLRTVADSTARTAISSARREAGMLVYQESDGRYYRLAADLTNWTALDIGVGGDLGTNVYVELATTADMIASAGFVDGVVIRTYGRDTAGDGAGSLFLFDADDTSTATNLGTVFEVDGGRAIAVNQGSVKVEQFGAVGDGTTDDTAALQDAFNAAPTYGGGRIELQSFARYKVVGPLFLTNDNLTLDGHFATLLLNDDSGDASLRTIPLGGVEAWTNRTALIATNLTIRDLNVQAQDMSTGKNLVYVHGIDGFRIEGVNIYGNGTNASWALSLDGWNGQVHDVFVDNRGALLQDGIHVFGGTNMAITECIVYAGDDAYPVGSDNNRDIADIVISDSIGISSHAWPIKVYTALTGPSGEMPDQTVKRVSYDNMVVHAGQNNNGALAVFDWAYKVYSASRTNLTPPRLITDVSFDGIQVSSPVPSGGSKTVEQPDLYLVGGDRITLKGFNNPTPWNNTLLVANTNLLIKDSFIGAPVRTNQATVQWLAVSGGVTNYSGNVAFDNVRFGLRDDVANFNIAPYYMSGVTFNRCTFDTEENGAPALYLGPSVANAVVTLNQFRGTSTNAAIYYGGPTGPTLSGPNWYDPNWTRASDGLKYQGSKATNVWHYEATGYEHRNIGTNMDLRITANGIQVSQNTGTVSSASVKIPIVLEVSTSEELMKLRRDSGVEFTASLAGGWLNWVGNGGQMTIADGYTDGVNKLGRWGIPQYGTTNLPVVALYTQANPTNTSVSVGGTTAGHAPMTFAVNVGDSVTNGAGTLVGTFNTNGLIVPVGKGISLNGELRTGWEGFGTSSNYITSGDWVNNGDWTFNGGLDAAALTVDGPLNIDDGAGGDVFNVASNGLTVASGKSITFNGESRTNWPAEVLEASTFGVVADWDNDALTGTDNTAALVAAVAYAATNNLKVVLPGGDIMIQSLTLTDTEPVVIEGKGKLQTTLWINSTNANGILVEGIHCALRDFGVYATTTRSNLVASTTDTNLNGILFYDISDGLGGVLSLESLYVRGHPGHGVAIAGGMEMAQVRDVQVDYSKRSGFAGILAGSYGGFQSTFDSIRSTDNDEWGVYLYGSGLMTFTGAEVWRNGPRGEIYQTNSFDVVWLNPDVRSQETFTTPVVYGPTNTISFSAGAIACSGCDFAAEGFTSGAFVLVSGSATADGPYWVTSVGTTTLLVDSFFQSVPTEAAGESVTLTWTENPVGLFDRNGVGNQVHGGDWLGLSVPIVGNTLRDSTIVTPRAASYTTNDPVMPWGTFISGASTLSHGNVIRPLTTAVGSRGPTVGAFDRDHTTTTNAIQEGGLFRSRLTVVERGTLRGLALQDSTLSEEFALSLSSGALDIYDEGNARPVFKAESSASSPAMIVGGEDNTHVATEGHLQSGHRVSGGTNLAGTDLVLDSGIGTGTNATRGAVVFRTPTTNATPTTLQTWSERMRLHANGYRLDFGDPGDLVLYAASTGLVIGSGRSITLDGDTITNWTDVFDASGPISLGSSLAVGGTSTFSGPVVITSPKSLSVGGGAITNWLDVFDPSDDLAFSGVNTYSDTNTFSGELIASAGFTWGGIRYTSPTNIFETNTAYAMANKMTFASNVVFNGQVTIGTNIVGRDPETGALYSGTLDWTGDDAYGELYCHSNITGQTLAADSTYYLLDYPDQIGMSNNVTMSGNRITVKKDGVYQLQSVLAMSGSASEAFILSVFTNAVACTRLSAQVAINSDADEESAPVSGLLNLASNDIVDLRIESISGAGNSITVHTANINLMKR